MPTEEPHYQLPSGEPVPPVAVENEYSSLEINTYDVPRSLATPSMENIQINTENIVSRNSRAHTMIILSFRLDRQDGDDRWLEHVNGGCHSLEVHRRETTDRIRSPLKHRHHAQRGRQRNKFQRLVHPTDKEIQGEEGERTQSENREEIRPVRLGLSS